MDELKSLLNHKKTLFSGHSGVGKSTLLNKIDPNLDLWTSEISEYSQKGTHTTTFAEMFPLNKDTFIIDTPGINELGVNEMDKYTLCHYFPEFRALMHNCKFNNCVHVNEPNCAVLEALEKGEIHDSRYYNYRSILENNDNRR
jgi:ribosome biogenesis GTPase